MVAEDLVLRRVLTVRDGAPELEGLGNCRTLTFERFGDEAVGRLAVCRTAHGAPDTVVVLGLLSRDAGAARPDPAGDAPIELRTGRSAISLNPDGRVRITGDDVRVESNGVATLRGAVVKLN